VGTIGPKTQTTPTLAAPQSELLDQREEERASATSSDHRPGGNRNPRVLAALCYALPFIAGGATLLGLLGAPRNRFVRLHAAQSLLLFALMGLGQVGLFVALVTLGNLAPTSGWLAVGLGLVFYALVAGLGLLCLILWLRLIRDCMLGRWRRYPLLTPLATRLERATRRLVAGHARAAS